MGFGSNQQSFVQVSRCMKGGVSTFIIIGFFQPPLLFFSPNIRSGVYKYPDLSAAPSFSTQPFQWKEGLDKHVFTYTVVVDPHAARATLTLSNLDMLMHINFFFFFFFTLNGRDVPVEIAWVHLREGYPDNVQLVVVDLTECAFTAHDYREKQMHFSPRPCSPVPLKRSTRRGCVQNIIKLKDVKGYLSQFNMVDPHHGWPLFIGALGHRQEKFLKEYCGLNSVVNLYRECPHHIPMRVDMEAPWANVPISPRFHKGISS
ncbi:hypothetical protein CEXT_300921 [Caerostris extrusa]|uniref:Uncharacterized protein n=1 Tax=Caerostris extrusa TaxID=172846 RepID=A0AAV4MS82_CAEEX|nr:hypothetical protein CEXT_300921 [Caerostris extrusa]